MKKVFYLIAALLAVSAAISSCSKDEDKIEPIIITLQDSYSVDRCKVIDITPTITGDAEATYKWTVTNDPENKLKDKVLANTKTLQFIAIQPGTYALKLTVTKPGLEEVKAVTVAVADAKYMVGISEVLDYNPAAGAYINERYFELAEQSKSVLLNSLNDLVKKGNNLNLYIGTFGGNVTFRFDHTVVNESGEKDFEIKSSQSETLGIVMVAYDKNKNGKPDDDEWYEIKGSEHENAKTIHDYQITYTSPVYDIKKYYETVRWKDNKGGSGDLNCLCTSEESSSYPCWVSDKQLVFKGTLLAGLNYAKVKTMWGYAGVDNAYGSTKIDLDWAVDAQGKSVKLPGIDYVKIYTATFDAASNESDGNKQVLIDRITDLHLKK